ncbi:MAG TPA: DUF1003 domain-containing protein [Gemmatimonadaceae bacterium]|nr:DUF1003 domain-containing protein [Gemmatimonadaceae bacterium]
MQRPESTGTPRDSRLLDRNVRAVIEHAAEEERARPTADRVAMAIWRFAGTMNFVYFHVVLYGLWAAVDLGWIPGIRNFDPTFTIIGSTAAVEAIFLAIFVLMAQLRMAHNADVRNQLDVQVSLISEQEITHILRLVAAMSERMGIEEAKDPEIQELLRELKPRDVLHRIEAQTDAVKEQIRDERSAR